MNKLTNQRDNSIDLLRFIGLTCIMLAHVSPPNNVLQVRTFDVPMMIFISGLSYSGRSIGSYFDFVKKRLLRLLVPVYLFATCYFIFNYIFAQLGWVDQVETKTILGTYYLQLNPSIGYLWIIRIFLLVMLVTPLLIKINGWVKSNALFILLIAAMFVGQHYLVAWLSPLKLGRFVDDYVLYLGYSIPFLLGIRMKSASCGFKWTMVGLLVAVYTAMAILNADEYGSWLVMQKFKYPPQVYYLLWGGVVSTLLWSTKEYWKRALDWKGVYFVAQNTIWIYLWHMPFAILGKSFGDVNYIVKLVLVYGAAITMFSIQNKIVDMLDRKGCDSKGYIKQFFKG